jgi:hypothetical protein
MQLITNQVFNNQVIDSPDTLFSHCTFNHCLFLRTSNQRIVDSEITGWDYSKSMVGFNSAGDEGKDNTHKMFNHCRMSGTWDEGSYGWVLVTKEEHDLHRESGNTFKHLDCGVIVSIPRNQHHIDLSFDYELDNGLICAPVSPEAYTSVDCNFLYADAPCDPVEVKSDESEINFYNIDLLTGRSKDV